MRREEKKTFSVSKRNANYQNYEISPRTAEQWLCYDFFISFFNINLHKNAPFRSVLLKLFGCFTSTRMKINLSTSLCHIKCASGISFKSILFDIRTSEREWRRKRKKKGICKGTWLQENRFHLSTSVQAMMFSSPLRALFEATHENHMKQS